jgi:hypothetical protein
MKVSSLVLCCTLANFMCVSCLDGIAYNMKTGMLTPLTNNSSNIILSYGLHDDIIVCSMNATIQGCSFVPHVHTIDASLSFMHISQEPSDMLYSCFMRLKDRRNVLPVCLLHLTNENRTIEDNKINPSSDSTISHKLHRHNEHRDIANVNIVALDVLKMYDNDNVRFWVSITLFSTICIFLMLSV